MSDEPTEVRRLAEDTARVGWAVLDLADAAAEGVTPDDWDRD